jgi:hypothetical protein
VGEAVSATINTRTAGGTLVDIFDPAPDQVWWEDIAYGLARQARYTGQTHGEPYSVAQHTDLAVEACDVWEAKPYVLLHDAHEFVTGDIIAPMKRALRSRGVALLDLIEEGLDSVIHAKAGLPWPPPPVICDAVRRADRRAGATEMRDLRTGSTPDHAEPPFGPPIVPLAWSQALHRLNCRFEDLATFWPGLRGLLRWWPR